jgi:hypothetical protein
MEVKDIVENLIKDIQEIEKKISALKNSSPVRLIEIETILSRLSNLYDELVHVKNTVHNPSADSQDEGIEQPRAEEEAIHPDNGEDHADAPPESEAVQDFELDPEPVVEAEIAEETMISGDEGIVESEEEEKKTSGIVADQLSSPKEFRNESLGKTRKGADLSSRLQSQPLQDISSAIGINDRFLFIKELFDGNSKKYDETIKVLNTSPNFNDAFNYLNENFNWDMDDPAVQTLLELTRRKHIINSDE